MQHRKKAEFIHPIIVWIIASILFHLLLMLGVITLRMNSILVPQPPVKDYAQERAILMMDEPPAAQRPIPSQPIMQAVQPTAAKKEEIKPVEPPQTNPNLLNFKIVPGRKGLDKQDIQDIAELKNLPTPDKQIASPEKKAQSKPTQLAIKQQEEQISEQHAVPEKKETSIDQEKMMSATQFISQTSKEEAKPAQQKSTPSQKKQDPYEFVPEANRTISFKDLNLGFNQSSTKIGNSSHLIMQGTSLAAPDSASLKYLTYYNQCARIIQEAFGAHRQVRLRPYATGKRLRFDLTVDRQGNNIKVVIRSESGDALLDKIIEESVRSVALFPKVPHFIQEDPFTMNWEFLH